MESTTPIVSEMLQPLEFRLLAFLTDTLILLLISSHVFRSVGPSVFQHLITRCSIFLPLPGANDCWTQLCGQPLSDSNFKPRYLRDDRKQASSSTSGDLDQTGKTGDGARSSSAGNLRRTESLPIAPLGSSFPRALAARPLSRIDSIKSVTSDTARTSSRVPRPVP